MLNFSPDKRGIILQASFDVFATYGFRKTSMDDIARAASMSRPALYQFFKNKRDIFRALSLSMLQEAIGAANAALADTQPFEQRITTALEVSILKVHQVLETSTHGQELMGVNKEIASDIDAMWKLQLTASFTQGLETAIERNEFSTGTFTADEIVRLFMHAMEGIKIELIAGKKTETDIRLLARYFFSSR